MLELAAVKPSARTADAPSQENRKTVNRDPGEKERRDFQSDYRASGSVPEEKAQEKTADVDANLQGNEDDASISDLDVSLTADDVLTEVIDESLIETEPDNVLPDASDDAALPLIAAATDGPAPKPSTLVTPGDPQGGSFMRTIPSKPVQSGHPSNEAPAVPLSSRKTTAELIITSKAAENASQTAIAKDAGPMPREGLPAARPREVTPMATKPVDAPNSQVPGLAVAVGQKNDAPGKALPGLSERQLRALEGVTETIRPIKSAPVSFGAPKVITNPMQAAARLEAAKDMSRLDSLSTLDAEALGTVEPRSSSQASTGNLPQVLGRPETPGMIARQMAEVLQRLPDKPVEISLNPRELGRVRMNIAASEAGITVSVLAERPETLDLMRRNIDQLAEEFRAIGYESISFAFAEGEAKQSFDDGTSENATQDANRIELVAEDETEDTAPLSLASTGVDIRL